MVASHAAAANTGMAPERPAKKAYPKTRRIRFSFGDPQPMQRHFVEGDIVLRDGPVFLDSGLSGGCFDDG